MVPTVYSTSSFIQLHCSVVSFSGMNNEKAYMSLVAFRKDFLVKIAINFAKDKNYGSRIIPLNAFHLNKDFSVKTGFERE